jgi:hypothetical protein
MGYPTFKDAPPANGGLWYDGAIMMVRTQVALGNEIQQRARQRATDLGVSFSEYVRRLVARDIARPVVVANVACVFDLGSSGGSDIARNKDAMIAEAFQAAHGNPRKN